MGKQRNREMEMGKKGKGEMGGMAKWGNGEKKQSNEETGKWGNSKGENRGDGEMGKKRRETGENREKQGETERNRVLRFVSDSAEI